MGINEDYLGVYCGGDGSQELFLFEVATAAVKSITLKGKYSVPGEAGITKPAEIGLYKSGERVTVLIHDVDLLNPTAKDSNIKIF